MGGHAEPVQQATVGGTAAEVDVLAGVDDEAVAGEGAGRPAQPGPGLEQGDGRAGLGQRDRGGDPGQAAADHGHPRKGAGELGGAHPNIPVRALTANFPARAYEGTSTTMAPAADMASSRGLRHRAQITASPNSA